MSEIYARFDYLMAIEQLMDFLVPFTYSETWDRQMSVSLGKGLVIARVNSCPGKEADHAPGWVRDRALTMWVNSNASGFCAAAGLEPRLALGPGHGPLNLPSVHRRRAGHSGLDRPTVRRNYCSMLGPPA